MTWRARNAGSPRSTNQARELVGGQAGEARALVARRRRGGCGPQPLERDHDRRRGRSSRAILTRVGRRPAQGTSRRPRSQSSPRIGLRPCGVTRWSTRRPSAVARAGSRPCADDGAGRVAGLGRRDRRLADDEPLAAELEERAGPRLVGADGALEVRGGPRRVEAAVLAPERPREHDALVRLRHRGQRAVEPARRATGRAGPRRARRGVARARGRAPSRRAATGSCATIGPVSSPGSMRISVTAVSASPARIVAGTGAAPRNRGSADGWRLSAPCAQVEQRRRDDLAVVREHGEVGPQREDRGDRVGMPEPRRGQDRMEVEAGRGGGDRRRGPGLAIGRPGAAAR